MRKSSKQRKQRKQNRKKTLKSKKQRGGYVVKLQDYHENIHEYNKIPASYRLIVLKGSNYSIEEHGQTTNNLTTDKHIEYIISKTDSSPSYRLESTDRSLEVDFGGMMKRPQEYIGNYDPIAQEFTLVRLSQPSPLKIIYHLDESKQYIETPREIDPTHSKLKAVILHEAKKMVTDMMSSKSTGAKPREVEDINTAISSSLQDINRLLSSSEGRVSKIIKSLTKK